MTFDLETQAYRCFARKEVELEALIEFFKELEYVRIPSGSAPVPISNWPDADKNQVIDAKFIVKKDGFKICCLLIKSDNESVWKRLANRIIKSLNGDCFVLSHNPSHRKWIFSSLSQKYSDKFSETRNAPLEFVSGEQKIPKGFLEFFKKITAEEDDVTTTITRKISDAFDNLAIQIHDELTVNVYDALKILSKGIIEEKSNNLELNDDTLNKIRSPIFTLLYRLILILYAEDRGIFPVDNKTYYEEFSLKWIKKEWLSKTDNTELAEYKVQKRLKNIFKLIQLGSEAFDYPKEEFSMRSYYGRLFDREINGKLESWKISNLHLTDTLKLLTRTRDKKGNFFFLDYAALDTRHLGAVYEHLLEFHLEIKNNKIKEFDSSKERKASGSYYTPKYVVDYIVKNSLDPLITSIIAKNPDKQTQIEKILDLKILDPAMGSGHFLVGAVEYIAKRICKIEFGEITEQAYIERKRDVVRRCIYGVDINPLAVDLASLSLWLETLSSEKPLSFLQSHLKCGNSLVGSEIESIFGKQDIHSKTTQTTLFESQKSKNAFKKNIKNFLMFEDLKDETPSAVKVKLEEYGKMQSKGTIYKDLQFRLNCKTAESFGIELPILYDDREIGENSLDSYTDEEQQKIVSLSVQKRFFHWDLEFPQIFYDENGNKKNNNGFDVVIGNPPYVSAKLMSASGMDDQKSFFKTEYISASGVFDLYVVFVEKGIKLLKTEGEFGFIIPNKFMIDDYGYNLRNFLINTTQLREIMDVSKEKIFGDVSVYPIIITLTKPSEIPISYNLRGVIGLKNKLSENQISIELFKKLPNNIFVTNFTDAEFVILKKILKLGKPLKQFCKLHSGTTGFEAAKTSKCIIDGKTSQKNVDFVVTGNIDRYKITLGDVRFMKKDYKKPKLILKKHEITDGKISLFKSNKIVIGGMTKRIEAAFDNIGLGIGVNVFAATDFKTNQNYILGLLNSKLFTFYYILINQAKHLAGDYLAINKGQLESIPIRPMEKTDEKKIPSEISQLCQQYYEKSKKDKLLTLIDGFLDKKMSHVVENILLNIIEKRNNPNLSGEHKELADKLIDDIIYKLYHLSDNEINIIETIVLHT